MSKIKNRRFGIFAEFIAIIFLKLKFYKILHRNYRNKLGEIDIIAFKNKTLIAIEVKARRNINSFEEVLTDRQMSRIRNSIDIFYSQRKYFNKYNIRFDLIIIKPYKLPLHLKNFWN